VRQLSLAYGPRGVTAHTIAPARPTPSACVVSPPPCAEQRNCSTEEVLDEMRAESSLGILTTPAGRLGGDPAARPGS
jgi:hypothetical protein